MKLVIYIIVLTASQFHYSQQSIVCTGGSSNSSNGNLSFSVGLIDYKPINSTNGNFTCGVQQPHEIYGKPTKEPIEEKELNISVYPNTFSDKITISATEDIKTPLKYTLFNIYYSKIKEGEIYDLNSEIDFSFLSKNIYFLKISNENGTKIFKLIKN